MQLSLMSYRGTQKPTKGNQPSLQQLMSQLVGVKFLFARRGYPRELHVHLGDPVQKKVPKGKVVTAGSYILSACASSWSIKSSPLRGTISFGTEVLPPSEMDDLIRTLSDDKEIDELLRNAAIVGAAVEAVHVLAHPLGYGVRLAFAEGTVLTIVPSPDSEVTEASLTNIEVPDWELFTPYDRYLRVGPGAEWSYLPSNQQEG